MRRFSIQTSVNTRGHIRGAPRLVPARPELPARVYVGPCEISTIAVTMRGDWNIEFIFVTTTGITCCCAGETFEGRMLPLF